MITYWVVLLFDDLEGKSHQVEVTITAKSRHEAYEASLELVSDLSRDKGWSLRDAVVTDCRNQLN